MSLTKVSYSMIQGAYVNVLDYGADPTGVLDSWQAIQNAIDDSIYGYNASPQGNHQIVYIPAGIYKITNTLQLGYGTGFTSVFLQGAGPAFLGEAGFNGTTIDATSFSDRPAINIQGGRNTSISDLTIIGAGNTFFQTITGNGTFITEAAWTDPSLSANAYSRYAPYAAVTIDAYSGAAPTPAYPAVPYPTWLGSVAQYNKNFSSQPTLNNVSILGFVVAVVTQPSGANGNGDFLSLNRCSLYYNKYAVSIGQGQSRLVSLINCISDGHYIFLTNLIHGTQTGLFGATVLNCSAGSTANFLYVTASYSGSMLIQNLYCELLYRIGTINFPSVYTAPIKFQSCDLYMSSQNETQGVTATVLDGTSQPGSLSFENCFINSLPTIFVTNLLGYNQNVKFINCITQFIDTGNQASIAIYKAVALNYLSNVVAGYTAVTTESNFIYNSYSNVTGLQLGSRKVNNTTASGLTLGIPGVSSQVAQYNGSSSFAPSASPAFNIDPGLLTSVTLVNKTLTMVFPAGYTNSIEYYAGKPGDTLIDQSTTTVFFIRSRVGNTVIAEMQNNYISDGAGGFNTITPVSLLSGIWFIRNSRIFTPDVKIYGTFTSGSAVITAVSDTTGFGTDIVVGTQVIVASELVQYDRIAVTAYNAGAATITLNGNASKTMANVALPMWIALPPANV